MKLSKREFIMIAALGFIVLAAAVWLLFISPAQTKLVKNQAEYAALYQQDQQNEQIINSVSSLSEARDQLKSKITGVETSLLPELDTEVIIQRFATIFQDHGLNYITEAKCDPATIMQIQRADGTYSDNSVYYIRINLKVSGTDGVTEGGVPAVGYENFIAALKDLESQNPNALRIHSIGMEDTQQGFQYFTVSVDAYAFSLANRISPIDTSDPYVLWGRDSVANGGTMGTPYNQIPPSTLDPSTFRPFASVSTSGGAVTTVTPTP